MQNLREIGSRYNGLQDALDAQKAALRGARDPQERRALRRSAAETRRELKRLKASLSGEALQAYRDYRAIRRDIRRCDRLKRYDRVESRIFRKVNPAYIYILPAANKDRYNNQEAGKSSRFAKNLWSKDVTVKLLQNQNKDGKINGL